MPYQMWKPRYLAMGGGWSSTDKNRDIKILWHIKLTHYRTDVGDAHPHRQGLFIIHD